MKIAIVGYGRMGQAVERAAKNAGHQISGIGNRSWKVSALGQCDVAIEFSEPNAAWSNVRSLLEAGIPTVCGTTGWEKYLTEARALCGEVGGAFLYASNFSKGVQIFFALNRVLAQWMAKYSEYIPTIQETHHIHKKDAPSGTAVRLAGDILNERADLSHWSLTDNAKTALKVTAHRSGEVPGTHEVRYTCGTDDISIEHISKGREAFAQGAVDAAEWLQGKRGCFGMEDVLDLHSL